MEDLRLKRANIKEGEADWDAITADIAADRRNANEKYFGKPQYNDRKPQDPEKKKERKRTREKMTHAEMVLRRDPNAQPLRVGLPMNGHEQIFQEYKAYEFSSMTNILTCGEVSVEFSCSDEVRAFLTESDVKIPAKSSKLMDLSRLAFKFITGQSVETRTKRARREPNGGSNGEEYDFEGGGNDYGEEGEDEVADGDKMRVEEKAPQETLDEDKDQYRKCFVIEGAKSVSSNSVAKCDNASTPLFSPYSTCVFTLRIFL